MSLLKEYDARTRWKYDPICGSFHTHEGLANKVDPDGRYAPFAGSTVVFKADEKCIDTVSEMQNRLYQRLDGIGMLADVLPASTIHMTLHDLISPEMCSAEAMNSREVYKLEVENSLRSAVEMSAAIREEFAGKTIHMAADRIVNMVAKALVLLLRPLTEEDFELLMELYERFDCIQKLPYPLTPHITLAYFRPGEINGDVLGEAVRSCQVDPERAPVFAFTVEGIAVQRFEDMVTYVDA